MFRIQSICKEKGITLQELASRLGVSYRSLYDNISGNPTVKKLKEIADALEVEVTDLFETKKESPFVCPHCGKPLNIKID